MFHIRHPIVLWQTFVIHCKANTNVCLALFCKVIWGAASHRKLHQLLAFEWLVSATTTSPWAPASGGCLGSCRSDTAAWHTATAPAQSQSPAHERRSQKDFSEWWGKPLKHSLRKPVSLTTPFFTHFFAWLRPQEFPSRRNRGKKCCFSFLFWL